MVHEYEKVPTANGRDLAGAPSGTRTLGTLIKSQVV